MEWLRFRMHRSGSGSLPVEKTIARWQGQATVAISVRSHPRDFVLAQDDQRIFGIGLSHDLLRACRRNLNRLGRTDFCKCAARKPAGSALTDAVPARIKKMQPATRWATHHFRGMVPRAVRPPDRTRNRTKKNGAHAGPRSSLVASGDPSAGARGLEHSTSDAASRLSRSQTVRRPVTHS
jgi:hypothetical protein